MNTDSLLETLKLFSEAERLKALELIVQGKLFTSSDKKLDNISVSDNSYLFVGDNQVNTIEKAGWNYSKKSSKDSKGSTEYVVQPKGVYLGDSWHEKVFTLLVAKGVLWNCNKDIGPLFPTHNGKVWKKTFSQGAKDLGIMLKGCDSVPAGYLKCNSADLKDAKGPECIVLFRKQVFEKAVEAGLIITQGTIQKEKEAPKEEKKNKVIDPFETSTSQNVNKSGTYNF